MSGNFPRCMTYRLGSGRCTLSPFCNDIPFSVDVLKFLSFFEVSIFYMSCCIDDRLITLSRFRIISGRNSGWNRFLHVDIVSSLDTLFQEWLIYGKLPPWRSVEILQEVASQPFPEDLSSQSHSKCFVLNEKSVS